MKMVKSEEKEKVVSSDGRQKVLLLHSTKILGGHLSAGNRSFLFARTVPTRAAAAANTLVQTDVCLQLI